MSLFKNKYKTESNRLQNWDYSSEGIYFITLATNNRENIFGTIDSAMMILNDCGKIIEKEIIKSIEIRNNWIFHNWVIMPNHIHFLIEIHTVETHCSASLLQKEQKLSRKPKSISSFVATFKSVTTKQINSLNKICDRDARRDALQCVSTEKTSIWQSNYHDHIVRNYKSFENIDFYITKNPENWNSDSINNINAKTSI